MLQDADGKFTLKFDYRDLNPVVTNAWGGVTKMFEIHGNPSPLVAVTAGMANLRERPIASYARDFLSWTTTSALSGSDDVADEFLKFVRNIYDEHYRDSGLPENIREGPEFLSADMVSMKICRLSIEFVLGIISFRKSLVLEAK